MHNFHVFDRVTFRLNNTECQGAIREIVKNNAIVYAFNLHKDITIPLDRLTYVPDIILTPEQAKQLCRYEIDWVALGKGHPGNALVLLEAPYTITLEDMLAAARNIINSGNDNYTVYTEWYYPISNLIEVSLISFENAPEGDEKVEYLPGRRRFLSELFSNELEKLFNTDFDPIGETMTDIIKKIDHKIAEEKKPIIERDYSDDDKENYIKNLGHEERLKKATELELAVYRKFIEDLIPKDNYTALKRKGYGCYGGDPAYECNWDTALECISRLYEQTGKAEFANSLGYIYYYGRCWDGEPKYDEAFKYFSVGAAGFCYESRYKLADMFVHGYGVPKNTDIAYSIVSELYNQNVPYILDGDFDCKFADVALRLGSYFESGYSKYNSIFHAYRYYLQADFAIRQRLQYEYYGDLSVADSIKQRITGVLESGELKKPTKTAYVDLYQLLFLHLKKYRKLQLKIKHTKNGNIKLKIQIVPFEQDEFPPKLFITEPYTGFCGLLETLSVKAKNGKILEPENVDSTIYFDNIEYYEPFSDTYGITFLLGDKEQVTVTGNMEFTSPAKISEKKYRIASVYFSTDDRRYEYLLDIDGVEVGDDVIVMTRWGEAKATVAAILEKSESELVLPIGKYKKVIEKA